MRGLDSSIGFTSVIDASYFGEESREFGLRAVEVFGDADVEKEAVDLERCGAKAADFGDEEIELDGKFFRQRWRPGEIPGENIGAGADQARTGAALLFKAYDALVLRR